MNPCAKGSWPMLPSSSDTITARSSESIASAPLSSSVSEVISGTVSPLSSRICDTTRLISARASISFMSSLSSKCGSGLGSFCPLEPEIDELLSCPVKGPEQYDGERQSILQPPVAPERLRHYLPHLPAREEFRRHDD